MSRIKKGDTVQVIAGKEKGKTGKVLRIFGEKNRLVVEKVNMLKKHQRPTTKVKGGIIEKEGSLQMSNVLLYCNKCEKGARFAYEIAEKKVRRCSKCGEIID
jgi:large subunit ribosomal protein L24